MRSLTSRFLVALLGMPVASSAGLPAQQAPVQSIAPAEDPRILLKYASFDPLVAVPPVPASLQAAPGVGLWIVQFRGLINDELRATLRGMGADLRIYLPNRAFVVRMDGGAASRVATLQEVRWVGSYHPAFRLDAALLQEQLGGGGAERRRYNLMMADKRVDKAALDQKIRAIGGKVVDRLEGSPLFTADLDWRELLSVANLDEVLWIDRWAPTADCMDNARIQGGGNYVETAAGYNGTGIRGHVYEGVDLNHVDFTTPLTNVQSSGTATQHGHCTAGIIFGNGTSAAQARGMAPNAVGFYTEYNTVTAPSRNAVIDAVVNVHQCMFTTASWVTLAGGNHGTAYTSNTAEADDIVFDHRIPWTQSQGNSGNQGSGMQSWAKNLISVGGVHHYNNSSSADDSWAAGGASTGPAIDGRIKPDLCAYNDAIWTSDLTGTAGYSSGNSYQSFNGTSGATSIVAGHAALAIQMYTDHIFGNTPRVPGGTRFQNRPLAQTLKAMMIVSASQYTFNTTSTDNRREHQGWGFPSLRSLYDRRGKTFIVPEDDVVRQGQVRTYGIQVASGESELKVCMTFLDPQGNPASTQASINDLSLRVTSPGGTAYWGNNGLSVGNYSSTVGPANTVDTVECVFVQNPQAGIWTVEVQANSIWQDAYVATGATDATYALVVAGGTRAHLPQYRTFASGCAGSLPTTRLTPLALPNIGSTLRVDLDNLPANQAIMMTGFSNTVSQLGALPASLSPYGMTGCWDHVSLDASRFVWGSANHATYTLYIPWQVGLLGMRLYQQALMYDPGVPGSAVVSDAAEATIGVDGGIQVPNMVAIPAGTFLMGSNATTGTPYYSQAWERPVHQVTISRPFWIGRYEVTQAEYQALMWTNPSHFQGASWPSSTARPVEMVTWNHAMAYCARLTEQQAALGRVPSGYQYRLPTEAEWEYCCRAGTTTEFHYGPTLDCGQARFPGMSTYCGSNSTVVVGGYAPNAWGLFDMHGNVREWCLDTWDESANYPSLPVVDPYVSSSGPYRVIRGGSWVQSSRYCRSAYRDSSLPDFGRYYDMGFRVVLAPFLP